VDVLPGEPHAIERAGGEVLDQHVAVLDQAIEDFLALGVLGIDGDRALVAVEHGEVEAVGALDVAQLAAGDVAGAGPLDLDAVGAHVAQELRAGRARLHVGEIEDAHAVERLAGFTEGGGRRRRQPCDAVLRRGLLHRGLRGRLHRRFLCRRLRRLLGDGFLHGLLHGLLGGRLRLRFHLGFCLARGHCRFLPITSFSARFAD
jgi:hypothetical protein